MQGIAVNMTENEIKSLDPFEGFPTVYNRVDLNFVIHGTPDGDR